MNSQTRAVLIASAAGLALAALSQAQSLMTTGHITLPTFNPHDPSVLGYWVGALGLFPLTPVVIVIAATARKAGWRSSIFNGLGALVGVPLVIICTVIAIETAHPKKELPLKEESADRAAFIRGASSSCAKEQRALPENKDVSAATIDAFCSCYANSMADVATGTELEYVDQHHTPAPTMVEKIKTTVEKCVQLVRGQQ